MHRDVQRALETAKKPENRHHKRDALREDALLRVAWKASGHEPPSQEEIQKRTGRILGKLTCQEPTQEPSPLATKRHPQLALGLDPVPTRM